MKKYFNKSIFKDKSFIKMICFTIVLLLVLVLGNTFGYVSADDNTETEDSVNVGSWSGEQTLCYNGWINSSIYDPNYNFSTSWWSNERTVDFMQWFSADGSIVIPSTYPYNVVGNNGEVTLSEASDLKYVCSRQWTDPNPSGGHLGYRIWLYDASVCFVNMNGTRFTSSESTWIYWIDIDYDIANDSYSRYSYNAYLIDDWTQLSQTTVNGTKYNTYASQGGVAILSNGNLFIQDNSQSATFEEYIDSGLGATSWYNCNYMLSDGSYSESGSGSSGANAGNYMYADSADWVLNNYSGNVWSNYNTWSVTFTSNLNQYIREEIGNLSDSELSKYYLDFDCYAYVEFYYQGVGQDVSVSSPLYGNVQFDSTTTIPGDSYFWSCTYKTPTDSHANLFKNINAKHFADGGYSKIYSLYTLFKYLSPNGTFGDNPISITLSDLCSATSSGDLLFDEIKNDWKKFNLVCTAKIYYRNGNEEYESGSYTENFDLLTGDSTIGDSSMLTNYNPYNGNSDEQVQLPSTTTGTSTASASTGNVTQTVTVTNDGAKYIPSLISKLIPTSLSDTGTGLVDSFSTMAQTNGFISVMASIVPAIPSTVWTYLTNYLGISLYLLACAFVLRLILDLL